MFAVQFGVSAGHTFGQALFTVTIFALFTIKNTLSIRMKSAFVLGYHSGCRVLKKWVHVKDGLTVFAAWGIERGAQSKRC
jgi:hypothetical protein